MRRIIDGFRKSWASVGQRKQTIQKLSQVTGKKKIYFECLTDDQLHVYVNKYLSMYSDEQEEQTTGAS